MAKPGRTSTTDIAALLSATDGNGQVDPLAYEAQRLILQNQELGSIRADRLVSALQASPALRSFGLERSIAAIDARLASPAERTRFVEALDTANLTDSTLERFGEIVGGAASYAGDQTAKGIAWGKEYLGRQMSWSYAWAEKTASDPNASALDRAIGQAAKDAVGKAQFAYGAGHGAIVHSLDTLKNFVDLGQLGYRFTTDPNVRDTVIGMARMYGAEVANDPSKPVRDVQQAASGALDKWEQGLAQARQQGREQEYLGSAAGAVGVEVAATLVPVSKLGKLGKVAKALDRITPDSLDEIGEVLTDVSRAMEKGGAAGEGAEQLLRGIVRGARDQGELLSVVKAARNTGNIDGLLRSGELSAKELAEVVKFDKSIFDGKVDFQEALGYSTKGVDLTRLSTRQLGDIGEAIQTNELVKQGYTDIVAIKNKSGHGIDLLGRNAGGELEFFEVKTSAKGLAPAQKGDPEQFVATRLQRAFDAQGHWDPKNTIPDLQSIARNLQEELMDPATQQLGGVNAKWIQLNLSRASGSPKLEVDRITEDWVKPLNKKAVLGPDQLPELQTIQTAIARDGRWNELQARNISASLYEAYAGDPLLKRIDEVGLATSPRDATVSAYALYKPFGNQPPFFHAHVDANKAAEIPEQQSLGRAAQVTQQLALQESLQRAPDDPSRGGPIRS
jgi:Holliday junction resolvase-like predicted endonuclease